MKQDIWVKTAILTAGLLVGFLIGRMTITVEKALPAPQPSQTVTRQPVVPEPLIEQKTFDTVNNVSPDDDPLLGDQNAPLMIIEFTDFQCPYCKLYFDQTYTEIKSNFIDNGKAGYVVRDFPLEEHPQAVAAAKTANCAKKQGKYWEMHDKLFSEQDRWSYNQDSKIFEKFASEAGLDLTRFAACFEDASTLEEISKDISDGQNYGITRIPTLFIGDKMVVGAQKFATFKSVIDSQLLKNQTPASTQQQ